MKAILFLLLTAAAAQAAPLTLQDYVGQVASQSPASSAARLHFEGSESRARGADVLTAPFLFGNFLTKDDQAQPPIPAFQGTETKINSYTVGVGWNSPYGFDAKYSWNSGYQSIVGILFPTIGDYTSFNQIDFTLHLFRNALGSEVQARREAYQDVDLAQGITGQYQLIGQFAQAEAAYWRLALARRSVQVNRDTLARSSKLLEWAKRRVSLQLGDRSDLLQAQANYDLHTIELSTSMEEERNSGRAFNLLRNREGEQVPETLDFPSVEEALRVPAPERAGERLDVKAAELRTKAAQAQTQLDKEALKPTVDLVGTYAWNGRDVNRSQAISDAFQRTHPTKAIGVNFTLPLAVGTALRGLNGANQEIEAAGFELDQARITEQHDWNELVSHLNEARARLKLQGTLEEVQKDKFENERQRLLRGRTTTYQTLTFEQDYASAQLLRLRTEAELLSIIAQMKTFRGTL